MYDREHLIIGVDLIFLLTAIWVLDYLRKESTWIDYQVSNKNFNWERVFFHHGAFFFFFFFSKSWSSPIVFLKVEEINLILCSRLIGWEKNSYGYHGDDGHSFCSSGTGKPYGPTFTTGDVIGCGINLIDNTCFYTKNGVNLGNINSAVAVTCISVSYKCVQH